MDDLLLTSSQNRHVKLAKKLWDRRQREKSQLFLIEGYRELSRAFEGGHVVETLLICPELFLGSNEDALIQDFRRKGAGVFQCTEKIFRELSYRDRPDGLLAIAPQTHLGLADLSHAQNPLYVVAESIEKPGNLGTILRSSDAAGVSGVIVCDRTTDIHNPNVVRSSVGTLFTLPVVESSSEAAISHMRKNGITILAATPSAELEFTKVDCRGPLAIVVGTEQFGLTSQWFESADLLVKIPMHGIADSLNVAMATTLLLYEAVRQRNA